MYGQSISRKRLLAGVGLCLVLAGAADAADAAGAAGPAEAPARGTSGPVAGAPVRGLEQLLPGGGGGPRDSLAGPGDWGAARGAIAAEFAPTAEQLAAGGKAAAVARQLTSGARPAPALPSVAAAAAEPTGDIDVSGQVEAAQDAYEKPATARSAEVTARLTPTGRIDSLEISVSSGSTRFDEAALSAVRRGLGEHPVRETRWPGQSVQARFRLTATRAVTLPRFSPVREPSRSNARAPSRGLFLNGGLSFDETGGGARVQRPFADQLRYDVQVLSVLPVPEPAAPSPPAAPASP